MIKELDRTAKLVLDNSIDYTISIPHKQLLYLVVKRIFDAFCSLIGILFLIPVAIIIKIAYMLCGDFHSIIYTQDRIGKDGKLFKFYKFRSMIPNADEELKKLLKKDKNLAREYKINKKLDNDPRITKAGKFISIATKNKNNVFLKNLSNSIFPPDVLFFQVLHLLLLYMDLIKQT
jgi:lipopolysaccharide/colanic/teichoic acid biosynthesis glycosyltransferase